MVGQFNVTCFYSSVVEGTELRKLAAGLAYSQIERMVRVVPSFL